MVGFQIAAKSSRCRVPRTAMVRYIRRPMRSHPLIASLLVTGVASGQMVLDSGTSLILTNSTHLRIEAPINFTIATGASLVNDGLIVFGPQAELDEQAGAPITGTGTEITSRSYSLPMLSVEPAGLGFSFTTSTAPDSFIVERGHVARENNLNIEGIDRWYRVRGGAGAGLGVSGVLAYDPSELNGIPEAALRMAVNSDGGTWWPELLSTIDLGAHTATSVLPDSLGWFTLFDDAVISDIEAPVGLPVVFALEPTLASERITISGGSPMQRIDVFDAIGSLWFSNSSLSSQRAVVDVSGLPSGAYLVLVNNMHLLRFAKP